MTDKPPEAGDAAWVKMQIDVAVTKEKLETVGGDVRGIRDDLRSVYATKTELAIVRDDVASLKNHVSWLVKGILGAVLAAILSLILIKGGLTRL